MLRIKYINFGPSVRDISGCASVANGFLGLRHSKLNAYVTLNEIMVYTWVDEN